MRRTATIGASTGAVQQLFIRITTRTAGRYPSPRLLQLFCGRNPHDALHRWRSRQAHMRKHSPPYLPERVTPHPRPTETHRPPPPTPLVLLRSSHWRSPLCRHCGGHVAHVFSHSTRQDRAGDTTDTSAAMAPDKWMRSRLRHYGLRQSWGGAPTLPPPSRRGLEHARKRPPVVVEYRGLAGAGWVKIAGALCARLQVAGTGAYAPPCACTWTSPGKKVRVTTADAASTVTVVPLQHVYRAIAAVRELRTPRGC